jgi:hypothetical protein
MAATKDKIPGSWSKYYNMNEEKIPSFHYDSMTNNFGSGTGGRTNPYNFVLLSGKALVPIITGIAGRMKTSPHGSPFIQKRQQEICAHIPSIQQSLNCNTWDEFKGLNGPGHKQKKWRR